MIGTARNATRAMMIWVVAAMAVSAAAAARIDPDQGEVISAAASIDQPADVPGAIEPTGSIAYPSAIAGEWSAINTVMAALAAAAIGLPFWRGWHRLRDAPARPAIGPPLASIALAIGFLILQQMGVAVAAQMFEIDPATAAAARSLHETAKLTLGAYAASSIALAAFLILRARAVRNPHPGPLASKGEAIVRRRSRAKSNFIAIAALLLAWPVVMTAAAVGGLIAEKTSGQPVGRIAHQTLRLFTENPIDGWYLAMAGMAIVAAPIMEEVFYRGVIQGAIVQAGIGRWPAIVLTSAAFAVMHASIADVHALAPLFVLSIAFGWAYEKTGRLAAPTVMHILFNAANFTLAVLIV